MKKYKLIKEYPGSPKLGSESFEWLGYKQSNYPDFWQEIVEKDYELLSFKANDSTIVVLREDGFYHYTYVKENRPSLTKEMALKCGFWKIYSIKRLLVFPLSF